ncbi:alpha-1,2-fucosyltransferase, partial [Bacteroidetes/Chlorobi group bacterium ChocPot_Mid]
MIAVKLKGGLGNQMFQYAFGRSLAIKNNTGLFLDLSYLKDRTKKVFFQFRDFELNIFNITSEVVENCVQDNLTVQKERHFHFEPEALDYPDNSYLDGYWQSEKYFKLFEKEIRNDFTFKNKLPDVAQGLTEKILDTNSICLHIRRGFTNNIKDRIYHGFAGMDYYNQSIELMKSRIKNPVFYVFSDNQEWCK